MLYAAESKTKYSRLDNSICQGTLARLIQVLEDKTGINYTTSTVMPEICFVFYHEELVRASIYLTL